MCVCEHTPQPPIIHERRAAENARTHIHTNVRHKCTLSYTQHTHTHTHKHPESARNRCSYCDVRMRRGNASTRSRRCCRCCLLLLRLLVAAAVNEFRARRPINKVLQGITSKLHLILCAHERAQRRRRVAASVVSFELWLIAFRFGARRHGCSGSGSSIRQQQQS